MDEPAGTGRWLATLGRHPWYLAMMAVAAVGLVVGSVTVLMQAHSTPSHQAAASNCGLINCGAAVAPGPSATISTQSHLGKAQTNVSHTPKPPASSAPSATQASSQPQPQAQQPQTQVQQPETQVQQPETQVQQPETQAQQTQVQQQPQTQVQQPQTQQPQTQQSQPQAQQSQPQAQQPQAQQPQVQQPVQQASPQDQPSSQSSHASQDRHSGRHQRGQQSSQNDRQPSFWGWVFSGRL